MKLKETNFVKGLKILIFLFITINFTLFSINTFSLSENQYRVKKKDFSGEVLSINNKILEIQGGLEDASRKKSTLQGEQQQVESDIKEIADLIVRTETLIKELDEQTKLTETEIANITARMKEVLKEIQKNQQVSAIQNLLSSRNFGEAMSKLYALSSAQADAEELRTQLSQKVEQLELDIAKQKQTKEDLENSKALSESKKGYLINLINDYKGKEDLYAQQVAKLKEEQKISEAEAAKLDAEWKKKQEELARKPTGNAPRNTGGGRGGNGGSTGGGSTGGSAIGCRFEDTGNPGIPGGFFRSPTAGGRINQSFTCSHDAFDIGGPSGSNLFAVADGTVDRKGNQGGGYGNFVVLKHTLPNGSRVYSLYAHMNSGSPLGVGSAVSKGQVVGYMGCTGRCNGIHVHFMLYSQSYESGGPGCRLGSSKCYNPRRFVPI
jgi:murein DD-endopeptidase MepM/ murein hydrolase activator NlpD